MDDVKLGFGLFILLIVFLGLLAHATEVEYISPARQRELESLFDRATLKAENPRLGKSWNCDMYGMRSKMQVRHDLRLYALSLGQNNAWTNKGAQVIADYQQTENSLVGTQGKFTDEIKMADDGRLISRLTLNSAQKPVVAYAVCKSL